MMNERQSSLLNEMEQVKSFMKLTPEERKKEVRRQMYVELKAIEMARRRRFALEAMEKCKMEREEREKAREEWMRQQAKQREEEEKRENEQKALEKAKQQQLKKDRLRWRKVMMVGEEPVKSPSYTISNLKEEQHRRREEAECCRLPKIGNKVSPGCPTPDLKAKEQRRNEALHNNWVGEEKMGNKPVKEKTHPNSTYLLFAVKPGPKSDEEIKTLKSNGTLQWLQKKLKGDYWAYKYQNNRQKEFEAEEQ